MSDPRNSRIETEQDAREAAARYCAALQVDGLAYHHPREAIGESEKFGLERNQFDDFSIIKLINDFKAAKQDLTTKLADKKDGVNFYQEGLDKIVSVLKAKSPTFLLAYEAEVYKNKRNLARENEDKDREALHSQKYNGLITYRHFLIPPDLFHGRKIQDSDGVNVTLPDGKDLTPGNDDQHVQDRMACILMKRYAPNLFKGFFSHAKSVVEQAEAIFRKKYS